MPSTHPRTSKRARQTAKAEVRKLLDELWDAGLLAEQFRKSHNEAQRLHALNSVTDPERWRGAVERSAAALVALKAKLAEADPEIRDISSQGGRAARGTATWSRKAYEKGNQQKKPRLIAGLLHAG